MNTILVLNAGSSSIKFATFASGPSPDELRPIERGRISQIGAEVELAVESADGALIERVADKSAAGEFDHESALTRVFDWLDKHRKGLKLAAVGHRIVHGGCEYSAPVRITDEVLSDLDALIPLVPLHQLHNLKPVRVIRDRWPSLAQIACFDTAFHITQPHVAQALALPREITAAGVRRFGFHGLSFEYVSTQLSRVLGDVAGGKVIVAHLGNGASLCAMVAGRSVATTMGFSVLDGLVMGTRCGTLDAGVVLYLQQQLKMNVQEVSDLLYHRAGLLGVSGISGDMSVLLASDDPRAVEAIDLFVYCAVTEIGAMAAAMGGVDALVFTAGIGEHAAAIRSRICAGCAWLGAKLDETANHADLELIHAPTSRLKIAVVPTDEELMIATHVQRLLGVNA